MTRILTPSEENRNYFIQKRTSKPAIKKLVLLAENIIRVMRILQDQMNLNKVAPSYLLSHFKQNVTKKTFCFLFALSLRAYVDVVWVQCV
jgi:hypothetical protein